MASIEYELLGERKDGSLIWVRVLGNLITFNGKPAISGTLIDITDRKVAEDALYIKEERLRVTLEATKIGIWDWDVENDIWIASPIYYTMLGYEPVTGPSDRTIWLTRIHPEDRVAYSSNSGLLYFWRVLFKWNCKFFTQFDYGCSGPS